MIQEAIAPQVLLIPQKKEINFHGIQIKKFWPSLDLRSKSLLKSPELRQIPKKSAHDESLVDIPPNDLFGLLMAVKKICVRSLL